jgi:hypothetical protein
MPIPQESMPIYGWLLKETKRKKVKLTDGNKDTKGIKERNKV